jgi:AraC-like DNA-binding protein
MNIGDIPAGLILFFILCGITGVVPAIAAVYLLLRRANAIAPGITPPMRLRRWTASFFAVTTLAHVWWLLFYIYSGDLHSVAYLVIVLVDCMLLFVTLAGMLLAMLQDRRRPVWPALVALIPFVALWGAYMAFPSILIEQITAAYLVLLGLLFTVHMIFAIRQYGRWLNDNYADLENKKVWLCQAVALGCMLLFVLYVLAVDMVLIWFIHIIELVLVGLLLWRVETLPLLAQNTAEPSPNPQHLTPTSTISTIDLEQIDRLLKEHCVATQLYLQHELSLQDLAQAIGTNRSYLSQYFSRQGITYNAYINGLRVQHFVKLYREAVANHQPVTAQQLAYRSGFRNYNTFSAAFKRMMGMNTTEWVLTVKS